MMNCNLSFNSIIIPELCKNIETVAVSLTKDEKIALSHNSNNESRKNKRHIQCILQLLVIEFFHYTIIPY